MFLIERRGIHLAGPISALLAVLLLCLLGSPSTTTALPVSSRDVVVQQTPIRVLRCPSCETSALILTDRDVIKSKKSGFSDQRIAELEGMLMKNRVRKSGFADQRLAEMEAMLLNGNNYYYLAPAVHKSSQPDHVTIFPPYVKKSGFSDIRMSEMETMVLTQVRHIRSPTSEV